MYWKSVSCALVLPYVYGSTPPGLDWGPLTSCRYLLCLIGAKLFTCNDSALSRTASSSSMTYAATTLDSGRSWARQQSSQNAFTILWITIEILVPILLPTLGRDLTLLSRRRFSAIESAWKNRSISSVLGTSNSLEELSSLWEVCTRAAGTWCCSRIYCALPVTGQTQEHIENSVVF